MLVEEGASRAPIIVVDGAPPHNRQVADELAVYMEKISGARPKVIEGELNPVPEHGIWVGLQPKVAELFTEIDLKFKHPEEILIVANRNHPVIPDETAGPRTTS